jgi:hypothetical protein
VVIDNYQADTLVIAHGSILLPRPFDSNALRYSGERASAGSM